MPLTPNTLPLFLALTVWQDVVWRGIPVQSGGISWSWLYHLPASWHPHPPHWHSSVRNRKGLECCVSTVQQWLKHPCVISALLVTCLIHSTIAAAVKEINLIQPKTCAHRDTSVIFLLNTFIWVQNGLPVHRKYCTGLFSCFVLLFILLQLMTSEVIIS